MTLAAAAALIGPRAVDSGFLLLHQDDPVALADHMVAKTLDATVARREIEAALASDDPELAASFVELAREQGIALDPALVERVAAANSATALAKQAAGNFAHGFVSGEPQSAAGFAGTAAGDLFVFGDVRDALREGTRFASGEEADQFILGLACVGLVVTAGTYATLGAATPIRAGMSLVKGAYKTGRIGGRLAASIGRSLRAAVDLPALRTAISSMSLRQPGAGLRGMRSTVKLDRAGGLVRLMQDTGRVKANAGTRAAMDGLKIAEKPKDMARIARLAEAKGSKTRAILKLGGRAAVVLTAASFKLASWLFSAIMALFGFCSLLKSLTERATHRSFVWGKARRLRRARRAAAAV